MSDFTPPTWRWRLSYEDGRTFSNEDGEPWESPYLGVMLLDQPGHDEDILATSDYLIFRSDVGRWMEVDISGLFDQLTTYGRFITCFRRTRRLPSRTEFRRRHREVVLELRGK